LTDTYSIDPSDGQKRIVDPWYLADDVMAHINLFDAQEALERYTRDGGNLCLAVHGEFVDWIPTVFEGLGRPAAMGKGTYRLKQLMLTQPSETSAASPLIIPTQPGYFYPFSVLDTTLLATYRCTYS
jgi:hypothetical protein